MSLSAFIKSKTFIKHLILSAACFSVLFWVIFTYIDSYTLHNETIVVPDLAGMKVGELDKIITEKNLRYFIVDSVYDAKKAKGIVAKQDPEKNTTVKRNRTIYLYVTAVSPPHLAMPKLKDRSLRQAMAMLETYGLKPGKITYTPDECINCVLQQLIKGKKIEPGTMVEKGSLVSLVVGMGLSDQEINIPNLIGLTKAEAAEKLSELALNEGSAYFQDPKDSLKARVYKQIPPFSGSDKSKIKLGSSIDLFFDNKPGVPALATDTIEN